MSITPDTKDWTWVLERPCPECGWDSSALPMDRAGATTRRIAEAWAEVLSRGSLRERPSPDVWSPLEYGCHVRDVFRIGSVRLRLMLSEQDPTFANWDQDAAATEDDYASQDPSIVAAELVRAAADIAALIAELEPSQHGRAGLRSDGSHFTVESFTRYLLHDPVHHLHDVGAGLDDPLDLKST